MKAITFKEKQQTLEALFLEYKRLQTKLKYLEQQSFYPSVDISQVRESRTHYAGMDSKWNRYIEKKNEVEEMLQMYEFVLGCLSVDSRRIIVHEFINKKKEWWTHYYSRSTYYRMKRKAMEEAIFYFSCTECMKLLYDEVGDKK